MKSKMRCLIVSSRAERFATLESILEALPIKHQRSRSCEEAGLLLCASSPAHVAFTDAVLSDGNWLDVLDFAQKSREKVNVVVVSPHADVRLYVDAMNHGAFDFVTETFTVPELVHVLRSAIDNACQARGESMLMPSSFRRPGLTRFYPRRATSEPAA